MVFAGIVMTGVISSVWVSSGAGLVLLFAFFFFVFGAVVGVVFVGLVLLCFRCIMMSGFVSLIFCVMSSGVW